MKTSKAGIYKLTGKIRPTAIQANSNYTLQPAQQMRENTQSTWPLSHAQQMSNTICLLSSWLDTEILVTLPWPGIMVFLCLLDYDFSTSVLAHSQHSAQDTGRPRENSFSSLKNEHWRRIDKCSSTLQLTHLYLSILGSP